MRPFSLITVSLALVASAHAATIRERAVSNDVQSCVNYLNKVVAQTATHLTGVNAYTTSQGYSGALTLHAQEQNLEGLLNNSTSACCSISATVTEEDAYAFENAYSPMANNADALATAYVDKKPEFDGLLIWSKGIIMKDIEALKNKWTSLDTCVLEIIPSTHLATIQGYADNIEGALGSAFTVYNATTTTNTTEAVSAAVQTCVSDIDKVASQSALHAPNVSNFTTPQGYNGALILQSQEQTLEKNLNSSISSCCSISSAINHAESTAVETVLNYMAANATSVITAYVDVKPQFDALAIWTPLIKVDLKSLDTKWTSLDTCLINFTPSDRLTTVQNYVDTIKDSFNSALVAYGII